MSKMTKTFNDYAIYGFLILIGFIYYIYKPDFLIEAEDARGYALAVMGQVDNWTPNPHHLLFEYIHMTVLKVVTFFGYKGDVYSLMQLTTILFSLGSLGVIFNTACILKFSKLYTYLTLILTAFAFGYWTYSSEADTYLIPFFFAVLNLPFFHKYYMGFQRPLMMVFMGLTSAFATVITQQYILLLPIISCTVIFTWLAKEGRSSFRKMFIDVFIFGFVATTVIISTYAYVCFVILDHNNITEAIAWIRGLTSDGLWTEFSWWKSPVMAGLGISRSIWGLNYLLANSHIIHLVSPLLPGSSLVEEHYAAVQTTNAIEFFIYFLFTLVGSISIIFIGFKLVKEAILGTYTDSSSDRNIHLPFLIFSCIYLGVFFLFAFLWEPENIEFLLHMIPIFWLVVFYFISRLQAQKGVKIAAIALAATVFCVNFFGSIKPYADDKNDYWNYANYNILQTATTNDLIVVECGAHCTRHIKFKSDAQVIRINLKHHDAITQLNSALKQHTNGRVFLSKWLVFPERGHPFPNYMKTYKSQIDAFYQSSKPQLIDIIEPSKDGNILPTGEWPQQDFWEYKPHG